MRSSRLGCMSLLFAVLLCGVAFSVSAGAQTAHLSAPGTQAVDFGTVAIGQSATISLAFTFDSGGTIGAPGALTQGAPNLDFTVAPNGTCKPGQTYLTGNTCTVNVNFTPRFAGTRFGAAVLLDNSGNVIATGYMQGTGSGPQVSFLPATQNTLGGGFATAASVAVDGAGNVYVAEYSNEVKMIPPGCTSASCVKTVGGGFNAAGGVAVDGAGNVFVADSINSAVKEIPPGCVSASCVKTLSTDFIFPQAIAVDGSGNLFVADLGSVNSGQTDAFSNSALKEIVAAGGYTTVNTLNSGFAMPYAVAVDGAGNVFVAGGSNPANSAITEVLAAGGYTTIRTLGSGFNSPSGVAVDGVGNVYVADWGNNALKMIPAASNYYTVNTLVTYGSNVASGITLDASGNIYTAVPSASQGGVFVLAYANAPTLSFATSTAGSIDTLDGTKTVTLQNIGNATLSLSALAPPVANFNVMSTATTCSASANLTAGASCVVGVQFAPTTTGSITDRISFTDNALNVAGTIQQVILSGAAETATPPPPPVITSQPPNPSGVSTATFTFSDTQSGVTFVCSLDSATYAVCSSGVSYSSLGNGAHTFAVEAADAQGNLSTAATYPWSITALPVPSIDAAPASPTTAATASFSFSDTQAGLTFVCSLDGAAYSSCTSGVSYSLLGNGAHAFAVEAQNSQGTVSAPATYSWMIATKLGLQTGAVQDFGTVPVGQTGPTVSLTYTFASGVTLANPVVMTEGSPNPNLDFAIAAGSCAAGNFQPGNSCTLSVTFTPKFAGSRKGAVLLKDNSGNTVVMGFLHGTGSGPQLILMSGSNYAPSSETVLGGGFTHPYGVAVDGGGNVYVADYGNNAVKMIPPGCSAAGCVTTLGGSINGPFGVAVDGGGNVYVSELNTSSVKEIPAGCTSASCVTTLGGAFWGPYGVAVDAAGNVFVADLGNNAVKEIPFGCTSATCVKTLGSGFVGPEGVAVDGSGNVFVVETGMVGSADVSGCDNVICVTETVALMEIPAAGGYTTVKTLQHGFNAPISMATDGNGNIYIAETMSGYGEVQEWLAPGGYALMQSLNPSCGGAPGSSCSRAGVAVDGSGNVYVVNTDDGTVRKMNYVDPPAFSFATPTVAGSTDVTDSFRMVTLLNNGNAPLSLSGVATSTNFTALNGGAITCSASTVLDSGSFCASAVSFTPATSGALTGTLTLTDNNLNVAGATQVVNLSGTGLPSAPTITSGPASPTPATTPAVFAFTDSVAGVSFLCSLDGAAYAACNTGVSYSSLANGVHSFAVEAQDGAGNLSTATGYTWTTGSIATQPPAPVITSGPAYLTTATSATLTFTDSQAGVNFLCGLNGVYAVCTSGVTYSSLSNGAYNFSVYAEDSSGILNFTPAVYNWFINTAPPPVPPNPGNFGNEAIGQTSPPLTLAVTFTGSGTLGGLAALTLGAPGLDFALASSGTCTIGKTYSAGNSCTINATFAPKAPGMRSGAVVLYDTSTPANVLATVYVSGIGIGPAIAYDPGIISTVVGGGTGSCTGQTNSIGDGCLATSAQIMFSLGGVAVDGAGNVYLVEQNDRVRKVTASTGIITTIGGTGTRGFSGDGGLATSAELDGPLGVAVDGAGNVYIADTGNQRIRKIDASSGIITTVAGNGFTTTNFYGQKSGGFSGDYGPATSAELNEPWAVAVDGAGNLYIADTGNACVREVYAATGMIFTVAGNGIGANSMLGQETGGGFRGDGGPATSALLSGPSSVALDSAGNLYIADTGNQRIREVNAATGVITTVAGNGYTPAGGYGGGYSGDGGAATSAELNLPYGVALDSAGNVYIADYSNRVIRKVNATTGIITTAVGNGVNIGNGWGGFSGDGGPATGAELANPTSVAVDGLGNLYIWDYANDRIRKVDVSDAPSLAFPNTGNGSNSAAQDVSISNIGNTQLSISSIAPSANFTLGGADTNCATGGQVLASNASCTLGIEFAPQTTGALTGTVTLTDNALNATTATQSIQLSGTGTGPSSLISTTTALNPSASNVTTGGSVTFTATVTPNSGSVTPTGSVTFMDGGAAMGTGTLNASGIASYTTTSLPLGVNSVVAVYGGDSNNSASTSTAVPVTVTPNVVSTKTTLQASASNVTFGDSVTFTATVTPASGTGTPSGTVTFTDGATTLATAKVGAGVAAFSSTSLAVGTHSIAAAYNGDSGDSGSASAAIGVSVAVATSSTKLSASAGTIPAGTNVTLTAKVTPAFGGNIPTGTVTFSDGATSLGTGTLNAAGYATLTTNSLAAGNHFILANYGGDSNNSNSISGLVPVTAALVSTNTALQTNLSTITAGNTVLFTATVTPTSGSTPPTGPVVFLDGATTLGTAPLTSNGTATYSTYSLAVGTHSITASYGGDGNYAASASTAVSVTVSPATVGNFGTIAVGQTSTPIPLTLTFSNNASPLGGIVALMQGAPALDFAIVPASGGTGACAVGTGYNAGDTCTVYVTFSPKFAGLRYGAVVLQDGSGNTVAMDLVNGIGSGPQVRLVPRYPRTSPPWPTLGGGLASGGIAVDGIGNVFVVDVGQEISNVLTAKKIPAGCTSASCVITLAPTYTLVGAPTKGESVALDVTGNVFVATTNGGVYEITVASGYQTAALLPNSSAFTNCYGIAVDQGGNVFITSGSQGGVYNGVFEFSAASGFATVNQVASGLLNPAGIAVDMSGNLFVTSGGNVYEVLVAGGYTTFKQLGVGFNFGAKAMTVDQGGNVFVSGNGSTFWGLYEILAAGSYPTVQQIPMVNFYSSIAVDASGNFYFADGSSINKVEFADALMTYWTPTPVGSTDTTDGPLTVTVQNIGNAPLNLTSIAPPSANFVIDSTTTTCSTSRPVAAGGSCVVGVDFTPAAVGALTGTLTLTDNALNVTGATQPVYLYGTGLAVAPPAPTITSGPANPTTATTATFTFTDTQAGVTFLCSLDSAAYAACSSGVSYSSLAVGAHSFAVEAEDSVGNISTATTYPWTVAPATTTVTVGATPSGLSFSVDGTTYTTSQTLSWTVGSTHTIATTSPQSSSGTQYTFASWSDGGAISHSVTASGNVTSYTATFNTSQSGTGAVTPDYSVSSSTPTQAVAAGGTATYAVIVQSTGAFNGSVLLSVTGLPSGATASFSSNPITLSSTNGSASTTLTVQTAGTKLAAMRIRSWTLAAPAILLVMLLPSRRLRRRHVRTFLLIIVILISLALMASMVGCGGGFASSQPYTLTITGTSGSDTYSTTVLLTVR